MQVVLLALRLPLRICPVLRSLSPRCPRAADVRSALSRPVQRALRRGASGHADGGPAAAVSGFVEQRREANHGPDVRSMSWKNAPECDIASTVHLGKTL